MGRMTTEQRKDAMANAHKVAVAYQQVVEELKLGHVAVYEIGRSNLYRRIAEKTGLSTKAIAYKINHCV